MSNGIFVLPVTRPLALPFDAAEKLINEGDGDAALLYIYILRAGGRISVPEAAQALGKHPPEISKLLKKLLSLGLITIPDGTSLPELSLQKELPEYSAKDIEHELESGTQFSQLVSEVQQQLGKILSSADLMTLYGIYDHLGMPAEVILLLVSHCVEEYAARFGAGRKPAMRTIEKKAYIWARNELFTLERAEAHIRRLNELKSGEEKIKRALGIKDRELSSTESRYVRSWIEMGFDVQTLLMAYDRTVLKTGKLSWAYMNSIVCSWHNQNIHSVEEIEKKEPRSAQSRAPQTEKQPVSLGGQELERLRQSVLRAQQNEKQ